VPPRPDLEDGLPRAQLPGVIRDRRRPAAGGVAHRGGVGARHVHAGQGVRRDLDPVGEPAARPLPADQDRPARRLVGAVDTIQRAVRVREQPA
jgi:hypothetical protein